MLVLTYIILNIYIKKRQTNENSIRDMIVQMLHGNNKTTHQDDDTEDTHFDAPTTPAIVSTPTPIHNTVCMDIIQLNYEKIQEQRTPMTVTQTTTKTCPPQIPHTIQLYCTQCKEQAFNKGRYIIHV